jgi:cysteine desulfurase
MHREVYLDHNATSPLLPEVAKAMAEAAAAHFGNPSSQHQAGRRARRALDEARDAIGRLVGARRGGRAPDRVLFTSGGSEANNLALFGLSGIWRTRSGEITAPPELIISAIEHPSVQAPAERFEQSGWQVHRAPVTADGVLDLAAFSDLISERTRLVSLMLCNNETGVQQPIAAAAAICRARGIPLHTDATQAAGKLSLNFAELGVTAMTLSAHKLGGPAGVGALVVDGAATLEPLLVGGFQQAGLRPGTEPLSLAVGFHRALDYWQANRETIVARILDLRDRFERELRAAWPDLVVNGAAAPRAPHTSNLAFVGSNRQAVLMALDMAGVACSTGSACASGSSEPSHVLLAMGAAPEIVASSIRFSLGPNTTTADIDAAIERIRNVLRSIGSVSKASHP